MKKKEYEKPIYVGQNLYIRPNYIVSMPEYSFATQCTSLKFEDNKTNLKKNQHNGNLSEKAIKNLKNAINWLIISSRNKRVYQKSTKRTFSYKISFITLTLPDTETAIKGTDFQSKLLNPFLVYLRKYHNLKNYVWKMEVQKNGKLHVHITADCFLHYGTIRLIWNRLLKSNGYLVQFKEKFKHENPNSTDVHSVYKVKNLAAYLSKYMSKQNKDFEGYKGKIWGCNYELSRANKTSVHIPANETGSELKPLMKPSIGYHPILGKPNSLGIPRQIGEIFLLKISNWKNDIKGTIKDTFMKTINQLRSAITHFTEPEFYLV